MAIDASMLCCVVKSIEVNHKRIFHPYQTAGLAVKPRRKRCRVAVEHEPAANSRGSCSIFGRTITSTNRLQLLTLRRATSHFCTQPETLVLWNPSSAKHQYKCMNHPGRPFPQTHAYCKSSGIQNVGECVRRSNLRPDLFLSRYR